MNKKYLLAAVLALASLPAAAKHGDYLSMSEVAEITGMHEREVRLMLGAYSTNTLYLTSFNRISREWNQAISESGLRLVQVRGADGQLALRVLRPAYRAA